MKSLIIAALSTACVFSAHVASAEIQFVRTQNQANQTDELASVVADINSKLGTILTTDDFAQSEQRELKNYRFTTYLQLSEGQPIKGGLIRTWASLKDGHLVQMEAHVDDGSLDSVRSTVLQLKKLNKSSLHAFTNKLNVMKYVSQVVQNHPMDTKIGKVSFTDEWRAADLVRVITVTGRRGEHEIAVSHFSGKILSASYHEFPNADLDVLVYPMYEQADTVKQVQPRIPVTLTNINDKRYELATDPYAPLRERQYLESMMDNVLGETEEGRALGYWSSNWLIRTAKELLSASPQKNNSFEDGGLYLQGKYVTINLHPALKDLQGIGFPLSYSGQLNFVWKTVEGDGPEAWELIPFGAFGGKAFTSAKEAKERPARRLPDHNMVQYINDGFDEIQVYYAVDKLFASLQPLGFADPELSTRPFHAYLYDPDISMRDNAYYTNDTINFTTYSPDAPNYARDNSTIWHELGHGVMDRLMGDRLHLADSGGLSEGMADFVAKMVIEDVTKGADFPGRDELRIVNKTAFHLTNESHDDGEAYGGAMNDILMAAVAQYGQAGVHKVTDLTLDAMRLARNHPALTANDWFEHMLFADELGSEGLRASGELRELILSALASRNYRFDRGDVGQFKILVGGSELTEQSQGSRYNPYSHDLQEGQEVSYKLNVRVKGSDSFQFKFPVTVEFNYNGGPLEGPAKWKNEEAGPQTVTLASEADVKTVTLTALDGCDSINREDGSCHDYTYIKVYNAGETHAVAKKRFYVKIK